MRKPVIRHVNGGLALLKYNIPDQWLIVAVLRFHIDKQNLIEDWPEALYLYSHRPAYLAPDRLLIGKLKLNLIDTLEIPQTIPPCVRKHAIRSAGIHERIAPDGFRGV